MSTTECSSYQAHAWKKDICANCMKARSTHSSQTLTSHTSSNQNKPVASKRISVQTAKNAGKTNKQDGTSAVSRQSGTGKSSVSGSTGYSTHRTNSTTTATASRSKLKRDNSSESSLSSKCANEKSSTKAHNSSAKTGVNIVASTRSKMKRDESNESNLSTKSSSSDKSTKGSCSSSKSKVGSAGAASRNKMKRDDSKDSILSDKSSDNGGEKSVEKALKTLTSGNVASPKASRKGSRTTMNYGNSLNNNTSSPTHSVDNTSSKANGGWLHSVGSKSSAGSGTTRVNIPLDKNVGRLSAAVNPEKVPPQTKDEAAKTVDLNSTATAKTAERTPSAEKLNANKITAAKVEKRKVLIDKGKYSTEKIIFDKTTVVTTTKENPTSKTLGSSSKSGKNETVGRKSSKEEPSFVNNKNDKGRENSDAKSQTACSSKSSSDSSQRSANKKTASVSQRDELKKSDNRAQQSTSHSVKNQEEDTTGKSAQQKRNSSEIEGEDQKPHGAKVVRRRSKSQRPQAPPPSVPPTGSKKQLPSKAMMESYHSDVSMSESHSSESQLSQAGASPTKAAKEDNSFSDLYDDIMNTLSGVKDITPDLLKKLKVEGPETDERRGNKHYYHKYDYSGKKNKDLSLSSAMGDGNSSIIVETMNTSFHAGAGEGEVEEVTSQTLAMPYNIVDVSTFLPSNKRDKSPSLPKTPAPESRSSTLSRSTLTKNKAGSPKPNDTNTLRQLSNSSTEKQVTAVTDTDETLQGLPPKYWHTYEPIDMCEEAKNNKEKGDLKDSQKSCDKTLAKCDNKSAEKETFVRQSKERATAPVRGQKTGSASVLNMDSTSLDHLDLQSKPEEAMSRSAENLLDSMTDSLGEPQRTNNHNVKDTSKKKNSSGFFRRLFGLSRKDNMSCEDDITEEGTSVDGQQPTSASSLQENKEFFKPLQIDTTDGKGKEGQTSPTKQHVGSPNLVAEIESAMSEVKLNTKDFKLNIPDSTSQPCDSKSNQNHVNRNLNDASPIEPYGTCKDFIFTKNEKAEKPTKAAKPKAAITRPMESPPPPIIQASKPTVSPKPRNTGELSSPAQRASKAKSAFLSQSPDHKLTVNIAMTTSVDGSISPIANSQVSGSASQCSLQSDGSSDGRSISSKEDPGSSGDSRDLSRELRSKKQRPKSQAVSRKMLNAPPPPPPTSQERRKSSEDSPSQDGPTSPKIHSKTSPTSPTKLLSNPFSKSSLKGKSKRLSMTEDVDENKHPMSPKKLEISAPIELQSSTLNSSQTLPRSVKKHVDVSVKESQDDLVTGIAGHRRMDSVAKHARNKTVTEGVKVDMNLLTNGSDSSAENDDRLAELLDKKTANRFVNRALPPTPAESNGVDHKGMVKIYRNPEQNGTSQDGDYEWVSVEGFQLRGKSKLVTGGLGDTGDDIYTDPIENDGGQNGLSPTKVRKSALKQQHSSPGRLVAGEKLTAPMATFVEYLKPNDTARPSISPKPLMNGDLKGTLVKEDLTLRPRTCRNSSSGSSEETKENYVSMLYVNTEMLIDKSNSPFDVGEGFKRMAFINAESLLHIANTYATKYIQQDAKLVEDLKFSHFVLKSTKPYIHQGFVAYYNARTYKLKPNECLLMISAKYINPDLLHHSCVHLLQPSLIFSDRILATYFPDSSKSLPVNPSTKLYQLGGMVQTNMAVITYHSIKTLENYVTETLRKDLAMGTEAYHRAVMYCLYQIMNAILSQQDGTSVYVVRTIKLNDILVVAHPVSPEEQYLVVNPLSSGEVEIKEDEIICNDIVRLVCYFLDIPYSEKHRDITVKIVGKSRYIASLKKYVDMLAGNSLSSLLVCRSILEYSLWGPTEKEIKSLLLSEDREQAFCIWLEVARCKAVNELALGQLEKNLELTHMFHFLCSVTGSTLLEVTKLLFKHK